MEAIRISCAGYPTRKAFAEFVDRFGLLAPEVLDGRCLSLSLLDGLCCALDLVSYH